MANQIAGRVYRIDAVTNISLKSGENIAKSAIIINTCTFDRYTGEKTYGDLYVKIDVMGNACEMLDKINEGNEVIITYDLMGSKLFTDKDGKEDVICHPRMISIRLANSGQHVANQPTHQQAPQVQAPQQPQLYKDPQTGRLFFYDDNGQPRWYEGANM